MNPFALDRNWYNMEQTIATHASRFQTEPSLPVPHLFRTTDDIECKPGVRFPLHLADGTEVEVIWAGSARHERLGWWLKKPGHQLGQSAEVSEVGIKGEDDGELRWAKTPAGARLFFVIEPEKTGKSGTSYRLAKLVTVAATAGQASCFRDERFALLGKWDDEDKMAIIAPLDPPPEQQQAR
jgi:hypothetical protein